MPNEYFKKALADNLGGITNHYKATVMANLLGYNTYERGICYGLTIMATQAFLAGKNEFIKFNRRLALFPATACLIESDLQKQWNKVCENPDVYITKSNIRIRMQRMLKNHFPDLKTVSTPLSDLIHTLDMEKQFGIIGQAIFSGILWSTSPDCPADEESFSIMQSLFSSVPMNDIDKCNDTIKKIRLRIQETIDDANRSINSLPETDVNEIRETLNRQLHWLEDLRDIPDNQLLELLREIPAFIEGAIAYATSNILASQIKENILKEAKESLLALDNEDLEYAMKTTDDRQSWELVQHYYTSDALRLPSNGAEMAGMQRAFKYYDIFSHIKLNAFFYTYREIMGEFSDKISFNIFNNSHGISCGFDSSTGQFWMMDANQMPAIYFDSVNSFSLTLIDCLSKDKLNPFRAALRIEAVYARANNKNPEFIDKIKEFNDGFLKQSMAIRDELLKYPGYDYSIMQLIIFLSDDFDESFREIDLGKGESNMTLSKWLTAKYGESASTMSADSHSIEIWWLYNNFTQYVKDHESLREIPLDISDMELENATSFLRDIAQSMKIHMDPEGNQSKSMSIEDPLDNSGKPADVLNRNPFLDESVNQLHELAKADLINFLLERFNDNKMNNSDFKMIAHLLKIYNPDNAIIMHNARKKHNYCCKKHWWSTMFSAEPKSQLVKLSNNHAIETESKISFFKRVH